MDLERQFMEAINRATQKWRKYKQGENAYKEEVNAAQIELESLIDKLKACIDRLIDLQDDYRSYIQRITQIREDMQIVLNQQIEVIRGSEDDCDQKINRIKQQFDGFVNEIKDWENENLTFQQLFEKLKVEIKRICDRADRLEREKPEREANKQQFESEIKETEDFLERLRQERGASKAEPVNSETKGREPTQQAQPENLPAGWRKERDPDSGRDYYFCEVTGVSQWNVPTEPCVAEQVEQPRQEPRQVEPRQQVEDFGEEFNCNREKASFGPALRNHILRKWNRDSAFQNLGREEKKQKMVRYLTKLYTHPRCREVFNRLGHTPERMANLLDSGGTGFGRPGRWTSAHATLSGGRRTRKKRGGWQTPEKLESISRYSPIRRVERKKKKKNTKNNKKNKRKRNRGKQTKRRRRRKRN